MRWLHESWCVGRWHLINPWRDKMGFSEVSAGFYRNRKILSFSLSEKDQRTLVYNLLSEFLILSRWNWEECLWQHSLLKKKHFSHLVWKQRHCHPPTLPNFWCAEQCLLQVGGAALWLELKLLGVNTWVSLLGRSLFWSVTFTGIWEHFPAFPHYEINILPALLGAVWMMLEEVLWDTWQQEFSFSWTKHSSCPI